MPVSQGTGQFVPYWGIEWFQSLACKSVTYIISDLVPNKDQYKFFGTLFSFFKICITQFHYLAIGIKLPTYISFLKKFNDLDYHIYVK